MVPVCDKRYHIYNRFRHFGADIKKLWNYPLVNLISSVTSESYNEYALCRLQDIIQYCIFYANY